jgi:hypothetical protein
VCAVWAWCGGGCARWYYLKDKADPSCPVCLSLPTAFTAEDPDPRREPAGEHASAHCPQCSQWFVVDNPALDTSFLCPACLRPADDTRWHSVEHEHGGAA